MCLWSPYKRVNKYRSRSGVRTIVYEILGLLGLCCTMSASQVLQGRRIHWVRFHTAEVPSSRD